MQLGIVNIIKYIVDKKGRRIYKEKNVKKISHCDNGKCSNNMSKNYKATITSPNCVTFALG